ncbi:muconolactone Delta-isomerase [Georgenia thermotolerans]|uniref:muconolactone Delta-isomerase n=1 Tax=Georgenia thermotolerans TaxID=527326 RepID=A0A7J5UUC0_9MICO|nr:muconolactone Delta-isomerase family protein [Georgenia thermotolerans]KAE8765884.1 muconolactone delta-isomerase [Georgenia thermotolerans]
MLYLVESRVAPPAEITPEDWQRLAQAESDYGIQARRDGHLLHIWRIAGRYAAMSIWEAADHDELHALLCGLPLFPYADLTVTALATHPSTLRWGAIQSGQQT